MNQLGRKPCSSIPPAVSSCVVCMSSEGASEDAIDPSEGGTSSAATGICNKTLFLQMKIILRGTGLKFISSRTLQNYEIFASYFTRFHKKFKPCKMHWEPSCHFNEDFFCRKPLPFPGITNTAEVARLRKNAI